MTLTLMTGTCFSVNASDITSDQIVRTEWEARQLLREMGYDEEEIALMPECEIADYQTAVEVSSQDKYYRVEDNTESGASEATVMSISETNNEYVVKLTKEEFEKEVAKANLDENHISPLSSDETLSSSGYLKAKITLSVLSNGNCKVAYTGTWVKNPANTKIDVAGAVTNSGVLIGSSPVYYYSCTRKTYADGVLTKTETLKEDTLGTKMSLYRSSAGCALTRNLKDDTVQYTPTKNGKEFSNHKIYLSYKVTYGGKKQIAAEGHYFHQKGTVSVSPSVSVGESIGAGISVTASNKMQYVSPNPYTDMAYSN